MKYAIASAINLIVLSLGIGIGLLVSPRLDQIVIADQAPGQQAPGQQPQTAPPAGPPALAPGQTTVYNGVRLTGITPAISAGDAGFYRLLSHHLQTDELVSNGFNVMDLHQGELNLLARLLPKADVDAVIEGARAREMLTVATKPTQPAPAPANPAQQPNPVKK